MNEDYIGTNSLVDTTDSLEAVGVFRGWKNFLFIIVLISLLLVQVAFWLVNLDCVSAEAQTLVPAEQSSAPANDPNAASTADAADPNQAAETGGGGMKDWLPFTITSDELAWALRLVNCVLILAAVLYSMSLLFGMKVSLMGRLGGVNNACRAFYLSLVMVILLPPWQMIFGPMVLGALFTPAELFKAAADPVGTDNIFGMVLYYLRFSGYWLLMFLLLIMAQVRSARWTRAILRRLEVI